MSESDVQKAAIDFLYRIGWLVLRVNQGAITQTDPKTGRKRHHKFCTWYALGNSPQSAGTSDILALEPGGRLWVIECKAPGKLNNLTQGQRDFQAEAKKRKAVVITIDSPDTLIEAVSNLSGLKIGASSELDLMIERAKEAQARECQAWHPEVEKRCRRPAGHPGQHEWRYNRWSKVWKWGDSE